MAIFLVKGDIMIVRKIKNENYENYYDVDFINVEEEKVFRIGLSDSMGVHWSFHSKNDMMMEITPENYFSYQNLIVLHDKIYDYVNKSAKWYSRKKPVILNCSYSNNYVRLIKGEDKLVLKFHAPKNHDDFVAYYDYYNLDDLKSFMVVEHYLEMQKLGDYHQMDIEECLVLKKQRKKGNR